jgi:CubicO group peptidase (beta-lactamase class C family)
MSNALSQTLAVIHRGIAEKLHLGAQLFVAHRRQIIFNDGIGQSRAGAPVRRDTMNHWLSSGKPLTAVAIAQLWERGRLLLDDPVSAHVPEFAAGGKAPITIRHLLTHTGGFRGLNLQWNRPFEQMLADIYAMPLESDWRIGETAGYHPTSSWLVLGEIVRRLDGRSADDYVRQMIFQPLGMTDSWIGMPPQAYAEYVAAGRLATMYDTQQRAPDLNTPIPTQEACAAVNPGGNLRARACDLGKFYAALLDSFIDAASTPQLASRQTVDAMTARHRVGLFDRTFGHVLDFGLGFIINSSAYGADTVPYGYGQFASSRTFGHSGAQSSCAFCDPVNELVAAWICNGTPGERLHQQRQREINDAIYRDLSLDHA